MLNPLLQLSIQLTGQRLLLPFWHGVAPITPSHIRHIYEFPNPDDFQHSIAQLLKTYTPIDIPDLQAIAAGQQLKKPAMFISFDDGLRELHDFALPILEKLSIPAAIFVNPSFVDNQGLFYRYQVSLAIEKLSHLKDYLPRLLPIKELLGAESSQISHLTQALYRCTYHDRDRIEQLMVYLDLSIGDYLQTYQPYMGSEELAAWQAKGYHIGAHSMDHPEYHSLSLEKQLQQTQDSIDWVAKELPSPYRLFAFPFTDYQVSKAYFRSMYDKTGVDLSFGTAGLKRDIHPSHFHRLPMEKGQQQTSAKLFTAYARYAVKRAFGKHKMVRT